MSRFGPDPRNFFDSVYRGAAPWDVGGPQPALTELFHDHPPSAPVLDLGCGSGDLALWLARSGLEVLGIDFAETAIAQARAKRNDLPTSVARLVDFRVADALYPSGLGRKFGTVVDSGFYHVFDLAEVEHLPRELAAALLPGGRYYLLGFATEFPAPETPRKIEERELRERFTDEAGWRILTVRSAEFLSQLGAIPAIIACIERAG